MFDFDFVGQAHRLPIDIGGKQELPNKFGGSYQIASDFLAAASSSLRKCNC